MQHSSRHREEQSLPIALDVGVLSSRGRTCGGEDSRFLAAHRKMTGIPQSIGTNTQVGPSSCMPVPHRDSGSRSAVRPTIRYFAVFQLPTLTVQPTPATQKSQPDSLIPIWYDCLTKYVLDSFLVSNDALGKIRRPAALTESWILPEPTQH